MGVIVAFSTSVFMSTGLYADFLSKNLIFQIQLFIFCNSDSAGRASCQSKSGCHDPIFHEFLLNTDLMHSAHVQLFFPPVNVIIKFIVSAVSYIYLITAGYSIYNND